MSDLNFNSSTEHAVRSTVSENSARIECHKQMPPSLPTLLSHRITLVPVKGWYRENNRRRKILLRVKPVPIHSLFFAALYGYLSAMEIFQLPQRQWHRNAATGHLLDVVLPQYTVSVELSTCVCGYFAVLTKRESVNTERTLYSTCGMYVCFFHRISSCSCSLLASSWVGCGPARFCIFFGNCYCCGWCVTYYVQTH